MISGPPDRISTDRGSSRRCSCTWDGTTWNLVLPPNVSSGNNALYGIGAPGANDIWAVGFSSSPTGPTQTLTERYSGPCPGASPTPTVTPTATVCAITFADVPVGSTFYHYIRCLACQGIISGYPCGGPGEPCPGPYFRPGNNVTRGQTAKIVANAAGFSETIPSTQQTFEDVPPGSTFWLWVERSRPGDHQRLSLRRRRSSRASRRATAPTSARTPM